MALAPKFAGQALVSGGQSSVHTLELFLDYVCPFSKKMFHTVYNDVVPSLPPKISSNVRIILRQQIQPWHPSSTLVHEAGVAVLQLAPAKFPAFSAALFDQQTEYFDVKVVNEVRNDTYRRLAKLAGTVGVDEGKVLDALRISDQPAADGSTNTGNKVTNDIKLLVKQNRLVGVHVTPTVIFNGIVENSISSSFTKEQWLEWLEKNVV
ncbi:hypothetical protein P152DRAFT_436301 [Eremomyces bilateralis CBS 781.70]|uniref:Thioredoxin-like fold domain-containing protein n=1 Tax=Eremomyces bilateralis CBS 781.70 TaxID=1392243 RepID=A0A6G1G2Q7_9PEZI|nr:uncharacterized protein P152DRAFT_436301 [Eremomyces bilateralis CBS 781.70]KAF1812211.1 hypothetical protein P152DRAFT_436301 [Eremomyces bilateralis CBS 781.70]